MLLILFQNPDIDKRSGLKKLHAKFPEIQKKLDAAYAKYHDNEKVLGGVVCIWSWMCVDSIMRNRLVDAGKSQCSYQLDYGLTEYLPQVSSIRWYSSWIAVPHISLD